MVIRHGIFEKPVTSPLVFHSRGACPVKQKVIVLTEEAKRCLFNQGRDHKVEERVKDIYTFINKLVNSGYGKDLRREILTAGIKRFYRLMLQEAAGGRSLYRSMEEIVPRRRLKGLSTRMWFRPTRGGNKIS